MPDENTRTMRAARGRYTLIEEIGSGSTATVWRARDTQSGREVALKRFHRHLLTDPVARRRIEEEAAAASRVAHPGIVSAVERVDGRDDLALVFPYVEGTTLARRLADGPPLEPRDAAQIVLEVADALAVAHEAGVVHRDVKPANIMLGADGRVRLLDFGISRALDEADPTHELTGAGLAIGTLPYMAPEQLAADAPTPASDVYGLGAVLYEMLAGRRPYAAASAVALAHEQQLPPARIDGAPTPLVDLALEALAADAALRPTAAGLARSLRAWLDGRADAAAATVSVVATPPLAAASPLVGTPRRVSPLAALIAAGLVVVLIVTALPLVAAGWFSAPAGTAFPTTPAVAPAPSPSPLPSPAPPTQPPAAPAVNTTSNGGGGGGGRGGGGGGGDHDKKKHGRKKGHH